MIESNNQNGVLSNSWANNDWRGKDIFESLILSEQINSDIKFYGSNGSGTFIRKTWDIFTICHYDLESLDKAKQYLDSDIKWNEYEIKEIADFINKMLSSLHSNYSGGWYRLLELNLDKEHGPTSSFEFVTSELSSGEIATDPGDFEHIELKPQELLPGWEWKSLPEESLIKKNIEKILTFLKEEILIKEGRKFLIIKK